MKKFNFRLDRKVVALFILVVIAYFAFTHNVKTAYATVNPSGLTGQFGCLLNRNGIGYGAFWQGNSGMGINLIMNINYSNNTAQAMVTQINNFNTVNVTTTASVITSTFTETAIAGVPSTYKLAYVVTQSDGSPGGIATMIGIVVNSGNTILLTQVEEGLPKSSFSGVCQKI